MSLKTVYRCPYCGYEATITIAGSIWLYARCPRHGWFGVKMLHTSYFNMIKKEEKAAT